MHCMWIEFGFSKVWLFSHAYYYLSNSTYMTFAICSPEHLSIVAFGMSGLIVVYLLKCSEYKISLKKGLAIFPGR